MSNSAESSAPPASGEMNAQSNAQASDPMVDQDLSDLASDDDSQLDEQLSNTQSSSAPAFAFRSYTPRDPKLRAQSDEAKRIKQQSATGQFSSPAPSNSAAALLLESEQWLYSELQRMIQGMDHENEMPLTVSASVQNADLTRLAGQRAQQLDAQTRNAMRELKRRIREEQQH